jgi:DNA modification methylase
MEATKIKITDLRRAEYNPRIMPEIEMAALKTSIKTFGFVESVVVNTHTCDECGDRKWVLVGGHQRTTAVEGLVAQSEAIKGIETKDGVAYIPANLVDLHLAEEKLLNLALNKIKGKWDEKKLFEIIVDLKESPSIPASGFRDDEISRILDQTLEDEEEDEGEGDESEKEPRSKLGEIYELGSHRLICGDSTDPETYRKLLGKEKADMVFTDPPYNVNYKSRGEKLKDEGNESIKNDNMNDADFKTFIDGAFHEMFFNTKEGSSFYICSGWSSYPQFLQSMFQNGFQHSGVIIWVKNVPSMGWNDYRYKHEWIARAKKPDPKTAQSIIYGWKEGTHKFYGDNEYDVWEMPRKAVAHYLHPTEKPDWLAMRALRNSTKRNDIVLDPFGGSGSTMAAAEKVGRRAYMIELDPKFCDVIRNRWERINKIKQ